jgi:hypothetical protein
MICGLAYSPARLAASVATKMTSATLIDRA